MSTDILLMIFLLCMSAFFSAAEIAFFSLPQIKIRTLVEQKVKRADLVAKIKSHPQKLLIMILVGNNVVNISASALGTVMAIDYFGSAGAGIAVGVMTFLILIFGEMLPKAIASQHPERFVFRSALVIRFLIWLLTPIVWILELFLRLFMLFTGKPKKAPIVTEEELRTLINVGVEEGEVERKESEMIERVFEFNDITAKEVMTPMKHVFSLNARSKIKDSLHEMADIGYSRIPVFDGKRSNIVGIVLIKDVLNLIAQGKKGIVLKDIMMKPHVVPEDKILDDLFKEFQMRRMHLALVVNEYGEITGVVTLEDLLEEIVGEIIDESDVAGDMIMRVDKHTVLADGDASILDIERFLHIDLYPSKRVTIAKCILRKLGSLPKKGKRIEFPEATVVVTEAGKYAIKRVKVIKKN